MVRNFFLSALITLHVLNDRSGPKDRYQFRLRDHGRQIEVNNHEVLLL